MKHRLQQLARLTALAALTLMVSLSAQNGAIAQTKPGATGTDPTAARKKIISGIKAYESGKMSSAISSLTGALSGGSLGPKDMAKALYYRGLAFRRQKQPAQAIADLNSAVWLKGGLSEKERKDALSNRASAYQEAGLRDPGTAPSAAAVAKATTPAPAKPAPVKPSPAAAPPPAAAAKPKALAVAPPAAKTATAKPTAAWQTATKSGPTAGATTTTATPAPATSGSKSPVAGITDFFSNVFGGSSSTKPTAPPPTQPPSVQPSAGTETAVSAWSSETKRTTQAATNQAAKKPTTVKKPAPKVIANAPPPVKKKVTTVQKAPPKKIAAAPQGKYAIQVASKRSQADAAQLVGQLAGKYGAKLGGRTPRVHEAVIGSMGTFYQVRIGPFTKSSDVAPVCKALKSGGHDCQLITNN